MFSTIMEKLLMADREGPWDQPLTADELLTIGRNAFEPLFHEPPIGPVPDYLAPHWSVHGCVAEYEEKLEELDRWKALELSRWLKDRQLLDAAEDLFPVVGIEPPVVDLTRDKRYLFFADPDLAVFDLNFRHLARPDSRCSHALKKFSLLFYLVKSS